MIGNNLGKVMITPAGEYSQTRTYQALDFVQYEGNGYIVRKECKGITPTDDGVNYMLAVKRGATGEGSGDMTSAVYDTKGKRQDIFDYADQKSATAKTEAISDASGKIEAAKTEAVNTAKSYTDEKTKNLPTTENSMLKSVYDKNNKNTDIFQYADQKSATAKTEAVNTAKSYTDEKTKNLPSTENSMLKSVYDKNNKNTDIFQYAESKKTEAVNAAQQSLDNHVNNKSNPHKVTAQQVNAIPFVNGTRGQFLGFTENDVVGAIDAPSGGGGTGQGAGKRTARFVVGTTNTKWTSSDCDYLCTGSNDEQKINAAINALPVTGGEIVLLDGTYNLYAPVLINKQNVKITGNGSATVLKKMWKSKELEGMITINSDHATVQSMYIQGREDFDYIDQYNNGILCNAKYCTIQNMEIWDNADHGIYLSSQSEFNKIVSNIFGHDNGLGQEEDISLVNCKNTVIDGNTFYSLNISNAINCDKLCQKIIISNNTSYGKGYGIYGGKISIIGNVGDILSSSGKQISILGNSGEISFNSDDSLIVGNISNYIGVNGKNNIIVCNNIKSTTSSIALEIESSSSLVLGNTYNTSKTVKGTDTQDLYNIKTT